MFRSDFVNGKKKKTFSTIASLTLLAASLLFMSVSLGSMRAAYAAEDVNGYVLKQPFPQYTVTYGNAYYLNPLHNFRDDGSMRLDFKGRNTDSLMIAGYFNIVKGAGNDPNICNEFPDEEISPKLNGGPHTDADPPAEPNNTWADTADLGLINFEGTDSRLRMEETHPDYSPEIPPASGSQSNLPLANDLCNVSPDDWIGVMAFKVNLDYNCDDQLTNGTDKIGVAGYIDTSGLNTDGTPKNNWKLTWSKVFNVGTTASTDWDDYLKGTWEPYVQTIGQTSYTYQTLRIDHQDQTAWLSTTDPPYKIPILHNIIDAEKNTCI
jgi:hypothetical protein